MSFTGTESHDISLQDAAVLTQNYRDSQSGNYIKGEYFSKEALTGLLSQTDCVGARIYYGLDSNSVPKLVIVGVYANEDDISEGMVLEFGNSCPPNCGSSNALNSDV